MLPYNDYCYNYAMNGMSGEQIPSQEVRLPRCLCPLTCLRLKLHLSNIYKIFSWVIHLCEDKCQHASLPAHQKAENANFVWQYSFGGNWPAEAPIRSITYKVGAKKGHSTAQGGRRFLQF